MEQELGRWGTAKTDVIIYGMLVERSKVGQVTHLGCNTVGEGDGLAD